MTDDPHPALVGDEFESVAFERASEPAVLDGSCSLSFGDLERISRNLAHKLIHSGWSGANVAVYCERSVLLPACLLGVMRSGCVYLPLDTASPSERLRQIVSDAEPAAVVTDRNLAPEAAALAGSIPIIVVEDVLPRDDSEPRDLPRLISHDAAYLIYTSGSTGVPKGVLIEHGSLANFVHHVSREFDLRSGDRVLAMASVAFDVSLFEILVPLYSGACTVILPRGIAGRPDELMSAIERFRPRVVAATPSSWQLLRDAGWQGSQDIISVSGAEALTASLAQYLATSTAAAWNHYGPTEAAIAVTTYRINGNERQIPLGSVITGNEVLVADESGQALPPGVPGELLISGRCLARGYWKKPEQTATRFVHLTGTDGVTKRYYRTGDLVRLNDDGNLYYLGRTDNQVKIRGFRIELEEVEAILRQHPSIAAAAALCKTFAEGDERLVVFYVARPGEKPDPDELRLFMRRKLPAYMVPSLFLRRDSFPLNANGKLDRQRLQDIQLSEVPKSPDLPVRDSLEARLLGIWRELPGFEEASATDDFFSAGGHSLLAADMIRRINTKLRIRLPISVLFDAPTVRDLVAHIESGKHTKFSNLVAIRNEGSSTPLICVHGVEGNVLSFERLAWYLRRDRPLYALQAPGLTSNSVAPFSIEHLAQEYLLQVRSVQPCGPYLFAGYSSGGLVAFEMARLAIQAGDRVQKVILFDAPMLAATNLGGDALPNRTAFDRLRSYLAKGITYQWIALRRNAPIAWRVWKQQRRQAAGRPLKPFRNFLAAFAFALKSYKARPLDVNAALFRPDDGIPFTGAFQDLGWRPLVSSLQVIHCPGDHANMFFDPNAEVLCSLLDSVISQISQQHLQFRNEFPPVAAS